VAAGASAAGSSVAAGTSAAGVFGGTAAAQPVAMAANITTAKNKLITPLFISQFSLHMNFERNF
jgi:hypothetical protein